MYMSMYSVCKVRKSWCSQTTSAERQMEALKAKKTLEYVCAGTCIYIMSMKTFVKNEHVQSFSFLLCVKYM